jgi:hypothetical protein
MNFQETDSRPVGPEVSARVTAWNDVKAKLVSQRPNTDNVLTDKINEAISMLPMYSARLLVELSALDAEQLVRVLMQGSKDETLIREYMMHFPNNRAIMCVRRALGLENLLTEDEELRRGITAAMYISHYCYVMKVQRRGLAAPEPENGYLTPEVARLIVAHPDREPDFRTFMEERELYSDEVNVEHLREYIEGQAGLNRGVL